MLGLLLDAVALIAIVKLVNENEQVGFSKALLVPSYSDAIALDLKLLNWNRKESQIGGGHTRRRGEDNES